MNEVPEDVTALNRAISHARFYSNDLANRLRTRADALSMVGQDKLAIDLENIADDFEQVIATISDAYGDNLGAELRRSQQGIADTLHAILGHSKQES